MRVMPSRVVAMLLPQLAVAVEERLAVAVLADECSVVAVPRGELDRFLVRAWEPERRVRLLVGLHVELGVDAVYFYRRRLAGLEERFQCGAVTLSGFIDGIQIENS